MKQKQEKKKQGEVVQCWQGSLPQETNSHFD